MNKGESKVISELNILLVLIMFVSGCATTVNLPKSEQKIGVFEDVLVFKDLHNVDLDKDGQKELVAIYTAKKPGSSSGVKVVKFNNEKGQVIFESIYNSSNVEFAIKDSVPTIMVEHTVQSAGCNTSKIRSFYYWDGSAFVLKEK